MSDKRTIYVDRRYLKGSLFDNMFNKEENVTDINPKLLVYILDYLMCFEACTHLGKLSLEELTELYMLAREHQLVEYKIFIKDHIIKNCCVVDNAEKIVELFESNPPLYEFMYTYLREYCLDVFKFCFDKSLSLFTCADQVTQKKYCCHGSNKKSVETCLNPENCCLHTSDLGVLQRKLADITEKNDKERKRYYEGYLKLPARLRKELDKEFRL
jgi:hypothetical protein